jgi:hypothetical protein
VTCGVLRFQRISISVYCNFSTLHPPTYFDPSTIRCKTGIANNVMTVRVYKGDKCEGGWTLQPLEEGCSDVQAFGSIQLVKE